MKPKRRDQHQTIKNYSAELGGDVSLLRKKSHQTIKIPVLCKFWREDDVWNGAAQDLAVAAFGDTFEDAQKNLSDAILCHLEALQELHQIEPTITYLQQRTRDYNLSGDEIPNNRPILRMDATLHDNEVAMMA